MKQGGKGMFRKLKEADRKELQTLVSKEPELNLFIIGDLESYGFEESFLDYWGQFEKGVMTGVVMRYHDGFTVYSLDQIDVVGVMDITRQYDYKTIAGGKRILDQFNSVATIGRRRDTYFAKLDRDKNLVKNDLCQQVERTTVEDLDDLQVLLEDHIVEFDNMEPLDRKKGHYEEGVRRGYHIKEEGKIIASAETTAENSQSAMIVAVATHPDHRGKGYATAVMSKLCDDLIVEGKSLCLFYDNPDAGLVYKRIGFEDIDIWSVWRVKE